MMRVHKFVVFGMAWLAPWSGCSSFNSVSKSPEAAALKFAAQPSSTPVSAAIHPAVVVQAVDAHGRAVQGLAVSMVIGTNAADGAGILPNPRGVLSGTLDQITDAQGNASFPDLNIDWLGRGYTLVASVTGAMQPVTATSAPFDETRVGNACLGPAPACSSGCADSDGDGLNDAWEIAGGVDLNGDGIIDAQHDLLLPGADPAKPDIYLKYDYMVAAETSPLGTPPHSHQPPDAAIQQVVEAFAAHGVTLHIDPQHDAIPEVPVTTLDPNPTVACAGPSFVTMETLRQQYFGSRKWAYHYGVFAHNAVLPDTAADGSHCPADPICHGSFDPTSSGVSELPGSSFIVALGYDVDNSFRIGIEAQAGTFMHELGHNFGLKHGSLGGPSVAEPQDSCLTYKPNYVSVMGYFYEDGIAIADQPGSTTNQSCKVDGDCPTGSRCTDDLDAFGGNICYRVDYSREKLLDLNEENLDETLGVQGPVTDTDIIDYFSASSFQTGPSNGTRIDWNSDGAIENMVQADLDNDSGSPTMLLFTGDDWETVNGAFVNLNFKFQCTTAFLSVSGEAGSNTIASSVASREPGTKYAREHHFLYPPRVLAIQLNPSCSSHGFQSSAQRRMQVVLPGSARVDASKVDFESLNLHGARPLSIAIRDVNNDGIPDLLAEFAAEDVRLSSRAIRIRLTGWMNNSQAFVGEADAGAVREAISKTAQCRPGGSQ